MNDVIKGKLMESEMLRQQAVNNSKEQFANSPDLNHELISAIMDASMALSSLSKQALESEQIRSGLKEVCWDRSSFMKHCGNEKKRVAGSEKAVSLERLLGIPIAMRASERNPVTSVNGEQLKLLLLVPCRRISPIETVLRCDK